MVRWVRRRAPAGRVLAVANQKPGILERYRLTREEADREVWIVDRLGRRRGGAAAINRVLRELGGAWPRLASICERRPLALIEDAAYRWFARHRSSFHRFGVPPECDDPDAGCA